MDALPSGSTNLYFLIHRLRTIRSARFALHQIKVAHAGRRLRTADTTHGPLFDASVDSSGHAALALLAVLRPGTPTRFGRDTALYAGLPRGEKTAII